MRYGPMNPMRPRLIIIRGSFCCQLVAELQFELLTLIAGQLQVTTTFCSTVKKKENICHLESALVVHVCRLEGFRVASAISDF